MYGIILAGDSGSRLWPLSRELYPTQMLKLNFDKNLLERTFECLMGVMDIKNIITITNSKHYSNVRAQLKEYDQNALIIAEPCTKNTASAISTATKFILDAKEDDLIITIPSNHVIADFQGFKNCIKQAKKIAKQGYIVTFGVKAKEPKPYFGYIETKDKFEDGFKVKAFTEKPDQKRAKKLFKKKNVYCNTGIYMYKASVFMDALKEHAKDIYEVINGFNFKKSREIKYLEYEKIPPVSISYALLEKVKNLAMVELNSSWNNITSWDNVYELNEKDKNNNVTIGSVINKHCSDSMFIASDRIIAGIGIKDTVVVETSDAVLVCNKQDTSEVKDILEELKNINKDNQKLNVTSHRPWGYYTVLNQGEGYLTKLINVARKGQLSLQSHNHRSEHWVILTGVARVTLDDKTFMLKPGASIDIPKGAKHSLSNPYDGELRVLEVQRGDKLSEEDIVRYKDIYGRIK